MDFKINQNVLVKGWSLDPIEGDFLIITAFTYDKGSVLLKNVENGHSGDNPEYTFDENQHIIGNPSDGSPQYWYVEYQSLIDPNNLDDIMKNWNDIPQKYLLKLGL